MARRVSKIKALTSEPHTGCFTRIRSSCVPFLPKVVLQFHVNQDIFLPVFCPKPHASNEDRLLDTLHIRHALAFYLECTKPFHRSTQLFTVVTDRMKDLPVSSQRISSWITICIRTCYELVQVTRPPIVTAHSRRAQVSSATFLAHVPHPGHLQSRDVVVDTHLHNALRHYPAN